VISPYGLAVVFILCKEYTPVLAIKQVKSGFR